MEVMLAGGSPKTLTEFELTELFPRNKKLVHELLLIDPELLSKIGSKAIVMVDGQNIIFYDEFPDETGKVRIHEVLNITDFFGGSLNMLSDEMLIPPHKRAIGCPLYELWRHLYQISSGIESEMHKGKTFEEFTALKYKLICMERVRAILKCHHSLRMFKLTKRTR